MKFRKNILTYVCCIVSIFLQQTFLGMYNNDIDALDLNEFLPDMYYTTISHDENRLNDSKKNAAECDEVCVNLENGLNLVIQPEHLNNTCMNSNNVKGLFVKINCEEINDVSLVEVLKLTKTKKRKLDHDTQEPEIKAVFNKKLDITFRKKYFNSLFGQDNRISDGYHSVPPQLIALMMRYKKAYTSEKNKRRRRVFGILCKGDFLATYEVKCVQIITDKNNTIWHICLQDPLDSSSIPGSIMQLHEYILQNSNNMNDILKNNLKYSAGIALKERIVPRDNDLLNDQKTVTNSVKELSALGGFPNKIIDGNDFISIENGSFLYFPFSYNEPVGFVTTTDWMVAKKRV